MFLALQQFRLDGLELFFDVLKIGFVDRQQRSQGDVEPSLGIGTLRKRHRLGLPWHVPILVQLAASRTITCPRFSRDPPDDNGQDQHGNEG